MSTSYDELPYLGRVHIQTHVQRIATIATVFQIECPDIEHCRVLELGCGDGSNLINMAYQLPHSSFLGIDSSQVQVDRGNSMIQAVNLPNIQLQAQDIMAMDMSQKPFDYIICHGVYSWVPAPVRERILQICKALLSPQGIAYVSYNALPGWRLYGTLRDMMHYHANKMTSIQDKVDQARAMVQFVGEHVIEPISPYGHFIRSNVEYISSVSAEYMYHEYLEEENQAFYFHEFIQQISSHDLQYLGDTEFNSMNNFNYPPETQQILDSISHNIFDMEQYMDFLRCRRFRCSLLTHSGPNIKREVSLNPFLNLRYSFRPKSKQDNGQVSPTPEDLQHSLESIGRKDLQEEQTAAEIALYRSALTKLYEIWPCSMHFDELLLYCQQSNERAEIPEDRSDLALLFQALYLKEMIDVHIVNIKVTNHLSEYPVVTPIARYQASYQNIVTTQKHHMIHLDQAWKQTLVCHLDGKHTVDDIIAILHEKYDQSSFVSSETDEQPTALTTTIRQQVIETLEVLLHQGLLLA